MKMKRIKTIKQLRAEQIRINQQQEELEDKIRSNWRELKESLRPVNIAKDVIGNFLKSKTEKIDEDDLLKSSFVYGVYRLLKKFADKAWEKLGKIFSD